MPRAELTVTVPEEVWIGEVSRTYPDARFRVLAALPAEETGVGLVEITARELESLLADVEAAEAVTDLGVLHRHEDEAIVQFETTTPVLLFPLRSAGIPLEMPFDIVDGEATWEVTASHDRLSTLGEQLEALGIRYRVEQFRQEVETERLLTEQQRDLVRAAVEHGYYDTPRESTLTELADEVGLAKSSVSETLHRAEERIVKAFAEELPAPSDGPLDRPASAPGTE